MKTLKFILTLLLLTLVVAPGAKAQNFDADRMNRDITIMESVLSELFKISRVENSNTTQNAVYVSSGSTQNVQGTYLPDFGVIFMISQPYRGIITVMNENSEVKESSIAFHYGDDAEEVNEENIIKRIKEFLRNYAATIGQLDSDERIMVIYGANSGSSRFEFNFGSISSRNTSDDALPIISVVAQKNTLDAYRAGNLNESQFDSRVSVATNERKEHLDLKVLGNIFETAFEEDGDEGEDFHLINSRSLSYLYLENFGAIYTLNIHRGHNVSTLSSSVAARLREINNEDLSLEEVRSREQKLKAEYDEFVQKMKEFIVDYGRTMSSVKDDQFILFTVNISERSSEIPDRVDFQIKRSTLKDMDRGDVNRSQAMSQIVVREYD